MTERYKCAYDELVKLTDLKPHPKNNNKHPEEQIRVLAKMIEARGQTSPIVVSNQTGYIIKGHGRLLALQKLGWDKAAVDFQDFDSEEVEYEELIGDNKIASYAEFDYDMFREEVKQYGEIDEELYGFVSEMAEEETEIAEVDPIDIEKKKIKIVFSYRNSSAIIDKFIREMQEKYPELTYQVEIDD